MATFVGTSYTPIGGFNTYVPKLQEDLIVEFTRNKEDFPINRYIDYRIVDATNGLYVKMLNNTQGLVSFPTDTLWAAGQKRPQVIQGNAPFEFPKYACVRYSVPGVLDSLGLEQGAWDLLGQSTRMQAQKLMTDRASRIITTLTTSNNWPATSVASATSLGGGFWGSASTTTPYIGKTLFAAQILIGKQTYSTVKGKDIILVISPTTASLIGESQEWLDFVKSTAGATVDIWKNSDQYNTFGLPVEAKGITIVVDDTVQNTAAPGDAPVFSYIFPDNVALMMSKKRTLGTNSPSFSTASAFLYQDMEIEVFNDPENRLTNVYVSENIDTSNNILVAPQAGVLITNLFS